MIRSFDRKIVRLNLETLSDISEQNRLFLSDGADGKQVYSFEEACCGLIDDSGLKATLPDKTGLGRDFENCIYQLIGALSEVNEFQDPQDLINSPQMDKVRHWAAEALKYFKE